MEKPKRNDTQQSLRVCSSREEENKTESENCFLSLFTIALRLNVACENCCLIFSIALISCARRLYAFMIHFVKTDVRVSPFLAIWFRWVVLHMRTVSLLVFLAICLWSQSKFVQLLGALFVGQVALWLLAMFNLSKCLSALEWCRLTLRVFRTFSLTNF